MFVSSCHLGPRRTGPEDDCLFNVAVAAATAAHIFLSGGQIWSGRSPFRLPLHDALPIVLTVCIHLPNNRFPCGQPTLVKPLRTLPNRTAVFARRAACRSNREALKIGKAGKAETAAYLMMKLGRR
jgi:hypothetical protein